MSSSPLAVGTQRTFPTHPRLDRYFAAGSAESARARLRECLVQGDGPSLLVGAAGVGKTMLVEVLAEELKPTLRIVRLAGSQLCTRRALLQSILHGLGLPYRDRNEGELRLGLAEAIDADVRPIALLVDEAQSLSARLLEELRQLSDVAAEGAPRVRLLLAGTNALDELFTAPELDAFSQRLAGRCYLEPLTRDETAHYVRGHLAAAGIDPDATLAADAYDALSLATEGVPRLVNQVAEQAIRVAQSRGGSIDKATIGDAWSELHQLSAPWHTPAAAELAGEPSDLEAGSPEPPIEPAAIEFGTLDETPTDSGFVSPAAQVVAPMVDEPEASVMEGFGASGNGVLVTELEPAAQGAWNADRHLDAIHDAPAPEATDERDEPVGDEEAAACIALAFPTPDPPMPESLADLEEERGAGLAADGQETLGGLTADPFDEAFDEEEVVLDPRAQLERVIPAAPTVVGPVDSELAKAFGEFTQQPALAEEPVAEEPAPAPVAEVAEAEAPADGTAPEIEVDPTDEIANDADDEPLDDAVLIVEPDEPRNPATVEAERRDYSQLFAGLRHG